MQFRKNTRPALSSYLSRYIIKIGIVAIVIYGVFESVNLALFNKWKVIPAIVDTLWGGILFYLTTWFYYKYSIWKKN